MLKKIYRLNERSSSIRNFNNIYRIDTKRHYLHQWWIILQEDNDKQVFHSQNSRMGMYCEFLHRNKFAHVSYTMRNELACWRHAS